MDKVIYKYELQIGDNAILMPVDAEILSVQTQFNKPMIWALVDPKAEKEERCFEIFGTGHPVYYDMGVERKFLSTIQFHDGDYVFHVFERIN